MRSGVKARTYWKGCIYWTKTPTHGSGYCSDPHCLFSPPCSSFRYFSNFTAGEHWKRDQSRSWCLWNAGLQNAPCKVRPVWSVWLRYHIPANFCVSPIKLLRMVCPQFHCGYCRAAGVCGHRICATAGEAENPWTATFGHHLWGHGVVVVAFHPLGYRSCHTNKSWSRVEKIPSFLILTFGRDPKYSPQKKSTWH